MKEPHNKYFINLCMGGWRPSIHGEYLDLYNLSTHTDISAAITTRVNDRNQDYVAVRIKKTGIQDHKLEQRR